MSTKSILVESVTVNVTITRVEFDRWYAAAEAHDRDRIDDDPDEVRRTAAELVPGWITDICGDAAYDFQAQSQNTDEPAAVATAALVKRMLMAAQKRKRPTKSKRPTKKGARR